MINLSLTIWTRWFENKSGYLWNLGAWEMGKDIGKIDVGLSIDDKWKSGQRKRWMQFTMTFW